MENPAALLHANDFERLNVGIKAAADELEVKMPGYPRSVVEDRVWMILFAFHRAVRDHNRRDGSS